MANVVYNKCKELIFKQELNLVSDTIKIILVYNYTANIDSHQFYSNVSAYEVNGTGYTINGKLLSGTSMIRNDTTDRIRFDAQDTVWDSLSVTTNGAIIYKSLSATNISPLIAFIDFNGIRSVNNTRFRIEWNSSDGIIYLT